MSVINLLLVILVVLAAKWPAHGQGRALSLDQGAAVLDAVLDESGLNESKKMFLIKSEKTGKTQYLKYDVIKTDLRQMKGSLVGSVAIQIADSKFSIHEKIPGCDIYLRGRLSFQVLLGLTSSGRPSVKLPKERFNDDQLQIKTENCGMMAWMVKGMVPSSLQESIQEAVVKVMKKKKVAY